MSIIANIQTVRVIESVPTVITLTGVDSNQSPITYEITTNPLKGFVEAVPNQLGKYIYTSVTAKIGIDDFSFRVKNSLGEYSAPAKVTVGISSANSPSVALSQSIETIGPKIVTLRGRDPYDNRPDKLVYEIVTHPSHGTLKLGSKVYEYIYTPEDGFDGSDTFTFRTKGRSNSWSEELAEVFIRVITPVNTRPSAWAVITNDIDNKKNITIFGTDDQTVDLSYIVTTPPKYGTLQQDTQNPAKWVYIPGKSYRVTTGDTFAIKINDGFLDSDPILMKVNANPSLIVSDIANEVDFSQFAVGNIFTIISKDILFTPVGDSKTKFTLKVGNRPSGTRDLAFTFFSDIDLTPRITNLKINYSDELPVISPVKDMTWMVGKILRYSIGVSDADSAKMGRLTVTAISPDQTVTPLIGNSVWASVHGAWRITDTSSKKSTPSLGLDYEISWTPKMVGLYKFNFIIDNIVRTVTINVIAVSNEVTNLPKISAPTNLIVFGGDTLKEQICANILAKDFTNKSITVSLTSITKGGIEITDLRNYSFNPTSGEFSWFPSRNDTGDHKFNFTTIDSDGRVSNQTVNIKVPVPTIVTGGDIGVFIRPREYEVQGYNSVSYLNMDGGHATANTSWSHQISTTEWFRAGRVTLANASTVLAGRKVSANHIGALMLSTGMPQSYNESVSVVSPTMRFHPGHRDGGYDGVEYDVGKQTYHYQSAGSSQSELEGINAYMQTAGAFKKEVFQYLMKNGLLMQTIVMLDHWTRVKGDSVNYMSSTNWPSFKKSAETKRMDMVMAAYAMTLDTIPAIPVITMTSVPQKGTNMIDYFDSGEKNVFYVTPQSIATLYRETASKKTFELDASTSKVLKGTIVEYSWKVTQGDVSKIHITPLNEEGTKVRVVIDYHAAYVIRKTTPKTGVGIDIVSNKIEIALFLKTDQGVYSVPAFFTSYSPPNEDRQYYEDGKIKEIYYNTKLQPDFTAYYKAPKPGTRDIYNYTSEGKFLGWDRHYGSLVEKFGPNGKLIP